MTNSKSDAEYNELITRRLELITKHQDVGLTPEEFAELKAKNVLVYSYLNSKFTTS